MVYSTQAKHAGDQRYHIPEKAQANLERDQEYCDICNSF